MKNKLEDNFYAVSYFTETYKVHHIKFIVRKCLSKL